MLVPRPLRGFVFAFAIIVGGAGPAWAADAAYLLKYKFQAGQFQYYEVENAMKIITQYETAKEEVTNTSQAWKQLRVVSADDEGNAVLEPIVERVVMTAKKDGEDPVHYDSAQDAEPPIQFGEVKKTIGKVIARVTVTANGELKQVTPLIQDNQPLLDAAKKNDPRLNFLVVMPKTPVKIGESWKDRFPTDVTVEKNLKQDVILQRTYTLTEVKGSLATIKLRTSLVTPVNDPQLMMQLIQRTPTAIIEFDLDQGRIVSMKTSIDETVIGAFGPKSSMSAVTKSTEKLLPIRPEFNVAGRPEKSSKN